MLCFVYASPRRSDTYVWLRERDGFDVLPAGLADQLGTLRFVLEIDMTAERQLPREDAAVVLTHLAEQGWHLQLPPARDATRDPS